MAAAAVAVVVVVGAAITAVVLNSQDGKPRSGPIDYSTVSPPASAPSASNGPQGQYKPVADLCPHVDTDTLQQALGQLAASPSPGTVSNLGPEGDTALCTTTYGGSGTTVQISATVAADRATARGRTAQPSRAGPTREAGRASRWASRPWSTSTPSKPRTGAGSTR